MRVLVIFGPPAVGKMSVGREVCARTGFRLFHNHQIIEPLIEVFGYGTRAFRVLEPEFRRRVFEEAAADQLDLCFTFVWRLDSASDRAYLERLLEPYADAALCFVELAADLDTRLRRNQTDERLAHKPSKRDLAWSDGNVRDAERHLLNTVAGERCAAHQLLDRGRYLRIDNANLSVAQTADLIEHWLAEGEQG